MERQIPKNVRQIGNVSDSPKIYVEDYVDTFFLQLCDKAKDGPIGAFLVGDMQKSEDEEYVYIYGAIQMHDLKLVGNEYVIDDETWKMHMRTVNSILKTEKCWAGLSHSPE